MGILSDLLDKIQVRALSPDSRIIGELSGRARVRIAFRAGTYREYDEAALEQQLVGLARRLWVARTRKYFAAVSEAFGETVTKERDPISPRDVGFHAARDKLVATGRSSDGSVVLSLRGMRSWTIEIRGGTIRSLTQEQFASRFAEAANALAVDQYRKVRGLKRSIYL